jgi:hypothetical protein
MACLSQKIEDKKVRKKGNEKAGNGQLEFVVVPGGYLSVSMRVSGRRQIGT